MKTLLEDYQRRLKSINELIENNNNNGSINDIKRTQRLNTKASEYHTMIVEIERAIKREKEKMSELRNELQQSIPTGSPDGIKLAVVIASHLKKIDMIIDEIN